MGKGLASMFKEAFPKNFKSYEAACKQKEVKVGHMFVTETGDHIGPKCIINFPTKQHWRGDSKMEWIDAGLEDLKRTIVEKSVYRNPALGKREWWFEMGGSPAEN
jgi:O-acetyl-ADP-ribose deacetylase (regulator of RNase III)